VVCAGINAITYSTTPVTNATGYEWTVPSGATILSGAGTTNITVNYGISAVSGSVTVAGSSTCGNGLPSLLPVTVNPLPAAAEDITGMASVCAGSTGVVYSVPAIAGAASYAWILPAGAAITYGALTNQITVAFGPVSGSDVFKVKGVNTCGTGPVSADFNITISAIPSAPVVTVSGTLLTSSAPAGNQWYYNGNQIAGATGTTYVVTNNTGNYWCIVNLNGCQSEISNKIWIDMVGSDEIPVVESFSVSPVPNDGHFTASIMNPEANNYAINVYDLVGGLVYELPEVKTAGGKINVEINLLPTSRGIYYVVFMNGQTKVVRRIFVN
jgi:hypothetical protein